MKSYSSITSNSLPSLWKVECCLKCLLLLHLEEHFGKSVLLEAGCAGAFISVGTLLNETLTSLAALASNGFHVDTDKMHAGMSLECLGCFLMPGFRELLCNLTPDSSSALSLEFDVRMTLFAASFLRFPSPSRSQTGLRTRGGGWRIRWGSRTWAGLWGSNYTTNMSRATQKGWASAAMTAAQKVRLQPWRGSPNSGFWEDCAQWTQKLPRSQLDYWNWPQTSTDY